ncbi:bifunctional proline dehydrogenase/L-glutamate gamma-semialdehyde dehydrogenase PutA [Kiloniella laminariae]|uniref:Bifunctional protein PutA n=1 Tax=Kiloniella laminariae TaxID=454162 RepID=A0ABT4LE63_9PROT|nr:bifunctional proline dehydrogenase/L-glutamate gamma-semialdehyde dehydrogenase PutA [Kiloniella laminariae]MCZ4279382.1 bifunctional proline dehydrogenase/L-glutamate gamma-semialdehyde dehydrogenase PutA [Kiloniella laminariae]
MVEYSFLTLVIILMPEVSFDNAVSGIKMMIIDKEMANATPLLAALRSAYRMDESKAVKDLIGSLDLSSDALDRISARARDLVKEVRKSRVGQGGIDAFMHEFELSSKEGVVLMCLAEALLRVPDSETIDKLIRDKLTSADWEAHLGHSDSLFVNASTWALMLTGRVVNFKKEESRDFSGLLHKMVQKSGEPVIRKAVRQAMKILGKQFVMGRTIKEALERAVEEEKKGYRYSYDMLGEGARTMPDADRYFEAYRGAIEKIGSAAKGRGVIDSPGISIKLSAIHPRYQFSHFDRVMGEVVPRLKALALEAKKYDIGLTIDAEEADRLEISLAVLEAVSADPDLKGWNGLGLAVQAYQKRAPFVIDWLADMAHRHGRRLMVRLVKGAYWDTEIKVAQEQGQDGYPVYTRKISTDVSYLSCARKMLNDPEAFYPQFASHNAHTVASILEMAKAGQDFEFQRLHGMGEALYEQVVGKEGKGYPVRIYAPVGSHEDLLAYLVRRLLENGANSSFVNRIQDEKLPIDEIIADPIQKARALFNIPHPQIPLPLNLYGTERQNSRGLDLSDAPKLVDLGSKMKAFAVTGWSGGPIIGGLEVPGDKQTVTSPSDRGIKVGEMAWASRDQAEQAVARADRAWWGWNKTPAAKRAECLERMADLMEENTPELMVLCMCEAGKTTADAIAEVREAVDFCRYYAVRCRRDFGDAMVMPGPTGERNELSLQGRGVFLCISPWNFPLAIFLGQVSAALAAGNAVIAKPAEQTGLVAAAAIKLFHRAGVPGDVLHLLPGDGPTVAGPLLSDERIKGVAFTGSTETAKLIQRALAARDGEIVPLIAETGGQNAMIVDSTALPEQVVRDVLASSFQSAGQRCSALRVLFLQADVADKVLTMLGGAMDELTIGDSADLATDVGPVIDEDAQAMLTAHIERMRKEAKVIRDLPLPASTEKGTFVAPAAFEIAGLHVLQKEVFGPVLHVIRFKASELDSIIDQINNSGFGLTLGIHSRIDETVNYICQRVRVGNAYVNRNQIGAIVGVQPFGGTGLSGTGPKAGGPRYLHRFATEYAVSIDTTAAGGNTSLMTL